MRRMEVAVLILLFVTLAGVTGVQIKKLDVPPLIENGTAEYLILDCDFNISESDRDGLVVKWFVNKTLPVYQWIPPDGKPQGLGVLKDKLDLSYRITEDPYKKYRALRILRPSIEMSGEYLCQVSTFAGEAFKSAPMLVYAPEKDMGIKVVQSTRQGSINVSCWAFGVFPSPTLTLYHGQNMEQPVEGVEVVYHQDNKTGYDVWAYKTLDEANLTAVSNVFGCQLVIPNANYEQHKTALYEPGSMALRDSRTGSGKKSVGIQMQTLLISLVSLLIPFYSNAEFLLRNSCP